MPDLNATIKIDGTLYGTLSQPDQTLSGTIETEKKLNGGLNKASAVQDYNFLSNKPKIEGVTLMGDKSFNDLGLLGMSNFDIEDICT